MTVNYSQLYELKRLTESATPQILGDTLLKVIEVRSKINDWTTSLLSETFLRDFRSMVARADIGWPLFKSQKLPDRKFSDLEILQLFGVERALHELCFCCENLEYAAGLTWGGSTGTRFYLNSFYHYVSSMFLIDTSKPSHKDLPMGGTVIKALNPMDLGYLLKPIDVILQCEHGNKSFGESILLLRHSNLVHGDFSPKRIEYLITATQMRDPFQQENFASLAWDLFYQLLLFGLQIKAIFPAQNIDLEQVLRNYIKDVMNDGE